jgi:hypothetical protein
LKETRGSKVTEEIERLGRRRKRKGTHLSEMGLDIHVHQALLNKINQRAGLYSRRFDVEAMDVGLLLQGERGMDEAWGIVRKIDERT